MRLIGVRLDKLGADDVGHLLLQLFRDQDAPAEHGMARIGKGEVRLHGGLAVPGRQHAHAVGEVLHRDLGAELVEVELVGEALRQRTGQVEQEAAAVAGRGLGDEEIHDDLALRRQQRAETCQARGDLRHIGRHQAVEEIARVLAAHLDDAAIRQKRCFHTLRSSFSWFRWG